MGTIKRALISVSDKTGIVDFAKQLADLGIEIISTGGTAKTLQEAGLQVQEVADYTGFPEMLGGRVKTLHPKIHAGILAKRDSQDHLQTLAKHQIETIDLVCVNLYPFVKTIAQKDCDLPTAIENIDIGGPTMVRSAAKNWRSVAILTDANDYPKIIEELQASKELSSKTLFQLAAKAFSHTAQYDGMISNYLTAIDPTDLTSNPPELNLFPHQLNMQWQKVIDLRYGENPHQQAAFYQDIEPVPGSIAGFKQLQGKELSYNNIADADAAWEAVKAISTEPSCVIVKHANPCGVAIAEDTLSAYQRAYATDKTSAFGGIITFNHQVDEKTVTEILNNQFMEVLMAPGFTAKALEIIKQKKNVRVLELPVAHLQNHFELKRIGGGVLVQTPDHLDLLEDQLTIVSAKKPSAEQLSDLQFLWKVAKFVKSNAIVFGKNRQTYGIGAGQMSRVDSTLIAARKAQENGLNLSNACAASDAFFPFRDGIDVIAKQGITAVIHPGGSIRDEEVIQAANEHGMVMIFTNIRHFRH